MYISSDTNVWFDFEAIGCLDHPFLLDNEYYISDLANFDEIQHSPSIREMIESNHIHITSVPALELQQAADYTIKYPALSFYDAVALSIAKSRGWILLSGDGKLREAAEKESVECHGTLWIYSLLKNKRLLSDHEYKDTLERLLDAVDNKGRRLPKNEIMRMLEQ